MAKKDRTAKIVDLMTESICYAMARSALIYVTDNEVVWGAFKAYCERTNGGMDVPNDHRLLCHLSGHLMGAVSDEKAETASRLLGKSTEDLAWVSVQGEDMLATLQKLING